MEATERRRFRFGITRYLTGAEYQRARIINQVEEAPLLLTVADIPVKDLSDIRKNDLDYYVYEVLRLRRTVQAFIAQSTEAEAESAAAAIDQLDASIPHLLELEKLLEKTDGSSEMDGITWFDSVVRLDPDGSVVYLIDPRYQQHDAVRVLATTLLDLLSDDDDANA